MSQFHYEEIIENQLLEGVRHILKRVESEGLEEPHSFYVSFLTNYPGVGLPEYLYDEYPDEMTIVIQYQFWELKVERHHFSVVLSFSDNEEKITIPFKSLTNFADPSVNFNLDFQPRLPQKSTSSSPSPKKETKEDDQKAKVIQLDRFRRK